MLVTIRLSNLGFGGTERVFLSVADHLSATYGWKVDFVVDRITGDATEQVATAKGYRLVSLRVPRTWKAILPFRQYLVDCKPDVVFSAYTETNAAALISNALNRFHTPVIVTEHASLDEHWASKPWLRRMMLEFMVRHVYKLANHAMCVSRGMAEQLGGRLKHREVGYIHNPVRFSQRTHTRPAARQKLGIPQDECMLLAVGRISSQKNYLMLLQAFKALGTSNACRLYIVGGVFEQAEKQRLDHFIAAHGLAESVIFVDFTHEVHSYYEAADLFVLSSAWEGFGNVLVEALSFGLPIVSTRCNFGPAEILEDGAFGALVDVDDHQAMARAMAQVLADNPYDPAQQIQRAQAFSETRIGGAYYRLICKTTGVAA